LFALCAQLSEPWVTQLLAEKWFHGFISRSASSWRPCLLFLCVRLWRLRVVISTDHVCVYVRCFLLLLLMRVRTDAAEQLLSNRRYHYLVRFSSQPSKLALSYIEDAGGAPPFLSSFSLLFLRAFRRRTTRASHTHGWNNLPAMSCLPRV
jgi:hypothetical protein